MRDAEHAVSRVPVSVAAETAEAPATASTGLPVAQYHQLLHDLTATLQLTPPQAVAVRQALAARPATASPAAETVPAAINQSLRTQLTATQVARLEQWQAAQPDGHRISLLTAAR